MSAEVVKFPPRRKPKKPDEDLMAAIIKTLPFVRNGKRGEGRCFWSAKATGDRGLDVLEGKRWAELFLPLLNDYMGRVMLGWVVTDMIRAGEVNGLVTGFMGRIGEMTAAGYLIWSHLREQDGGDGNPAA